MVHLPFGGMHHNPHHFEMVARQKVHEAKVRAERGARNIRLGVHRRDVRRPGLFFRMFKRFFGRS